jgi:hypothetical protein
MRDCGGRLPSVGDCVLRAVGAHSGSVVRVTYAVGDNRETSAQGRHSQQAKFPVQLTATGG